MDGSLNSGALLAGRYRILARIGEGGFGTVYKARDQRKHGKLVAIKEINMAKLSAQEKIEATDTFNREISLLSWLSHKNLPRISDQFSDPEHWDIVMEYIEGQTLEDLLARSPKGRLSVGQTATGIGSTSSTSALPAATDPARCAIPACSARLATPPPSNTVACKPPPRPTFTAWVPPCKRCLLGKNPWRSASKAYPRVCVFPGNCKR